MKVLILWAILNRRLVRFYCPNLKSIGLGRVADISDTGESIKGAFGRMAELSTGKDTTSGHWEMDGASRLQFRSQPFMKVFQRVDGYFHKRNRLWLFR